MAALIELLASETSDFSMFLENESKPLKLEQLELPNEFLFAPELDENSMDRQLFNESPLKSESDVSPVSSPSSSPHPEFSHIGFRSISQDNSPFSSFDSYESLNFSASQRPQYNRLTKTAEVEELRDLIRFSSFDRNEKGGNRGRRESTTRESQQEKHKSAEKKRRNDMNEVIDRLKSMLPLESKENSKMTKISILMETADYLQKVQDLCVKLLRQNKQVTEDNHRLANEVHALKNQQPVSVPLPPASIHSMPNVPTSVSVRVPSPNVMTNPVPISNVSPPSFHRPLTYIVPFDSVSLEDEQSYGPSKKRKTESQSEMHRLSPYPANGNNSSISTIFVS